MCQYQAWEDDSLQSEEFVQSTPDGVDIAGTRWGARLADLEERMSRVEARVERLEARMSYLQKEMRVVCVLFLKELMLGKEILRMLYRSSQTLLVSQYAKTQ